MPTPHHLNEMLEVYGYPSQAFWRAFEVDVLSSVTLDRPILELGCSNGAFTSKVCGTVEVGIDINPRAVEIARKSGIFQCVRLQDARELDDKPEFRTVFANSVLEHIPDLGSVLAGCYRALQQGGKLVATVPLVDMNRSMLLSFPAWIRYRQDRLSHVNLLTLDQWRQNLHAAGFDIARTQRYLSPRQIRIWDGMDGLAVIGSRRINLGSVSSKVTKSLPAPWRRFIYSTWSMTLGDKLKDEGCESGCCALIIAVKR